ncbi:MAG: hypothetical protein ACLFR8_02005 [Alkalispirochaeta sp.]
MESSLAGGFETPLIEVIATFLVVFAVITGFAIYSIRKRNRAERLRGEEEAARYRELVERYGLSRSDEEVISVLATYLRRNTAAYLLLQSQGLVNQAATLALADQKVPSGSLSSLRVRLGFTGRVGGGGASLYNLEHPRSLDLVATVLRTSRGGGVIHVRYGNIRESDRDRVYRLLFQPPPHGTDQGSSRRSHPS